MIHPCLQSIALLRQFGQLVGLLLYKALEVQKTRFSNISSLIRDFGEFLGRGDGILIDLSLLRQGHLGREKGVLFL